MSGRRCRAAQGSALVEVVVAMLVFATGVLAVLQMQYLTMLVWHDEQQREAARHTIRQIADEIGYGIRPVSGRSQHAWGEAHWSPVGEGVEVIASVRHRPADTTAPTASRATQMSDLRLWVALPMTGSGAP